MNYNELSNEELDKLSAENICGYEWIDKLHVKNGDEYIVDGSMWSPTSPRLNQAERYLFPKLFNTAIDINIEQRADSFWININSGGDGKWDIEHSCCHEGIPKINRTKVIACLEANEILKGGE